MSLETLLEAVNYVEKKETTASNDKDSKTPVPEMTSASSTEGTKQTKSNGALKHWRKRAVAQSVLESQNEESIKIDQQSKSCRAVSSDTTPLQNSLELVVTGSVMSPGHVRPTIPQNTPTFNSELLSSVESSKSAQQTSHALSAIPSSGNWPRSEVQISQTKESSDLPFSPVTSYDLLKQSHQSIQGTITNPSAHQPFTTVMGDFESRTLQQSSCTWPASLASESSTRFSATSSQSPFGSDVQNNSATSTEVHRSNSLNFYDDSLSKMKATPTSSDPSTHPSLRPELYQDEYAYSRQNNSANSDKQKSQPGAVTREAHNLLEKNRRAHLKECFDNLRHVVPGLGTKKVSNLTILRESLKYVQTLKRKEQKQEHDLESLVREKIDKSERLSQLCRDLGSSLGKNKIDEILKSSEIHDEHIKKIVSPMKPIVAEKTAPAIVRKDPMTDKLVIPSTREAAASEPHSAVEQGGPAGFFPSRLIDSDTKSAENAEKVPVPGIPIQTQTVLPDRLGFAGSTTGPQLPVQLLANSASLMPNSTGYQPWSVALKGETTTASAKTFGQTFVPSLSSTVVTNQITLGLNSTASRRNPLVGKLSQISANPADTLVYPHVEQCMLSATSHRVPSIRSYTSKVPTTGIASLIDGGNVPSQLKIIVKHVDSAKQQARVAKTARGDATKNPMHEPVRVSKAGTLVYRPRSSVTPPPPSKITPYFPLFSVGSGGSPPLTTVLPSRGDSVPRSEEERREENLQRDQLKMWAAMSAAEAPFGNQFSQTFAPKRKATNTLERSPQSKCAKTNSLESTSASLVPPQVFGTGARTIMSPLRTAESGTKLSSVISTEARKSSATVGASLLNSLPSLSSTALMFPQFYNQSSHSVTQVCYSTLVKSVRPAVSSTLLPGSTNSQLVQDKTEPSVFTTALSRPKAEHAIPQFSSMKSGLQIGANMQIGAGFGAQMPQVAYQIVQPAYMNPSFMQSHASNTVTVSAAACAVVSNNAGNGLKGKSPSTSGNSVVRSDTTPLTPQKALQLPSSIAQPQPQIQYVIPMGYAGMVGGGGATPMGFSPAMGGFMQLASMPQGQGCMGYMVPQNMMFAAANKNGGMVNFVENGISSPKQVENIGSGLMTSASAKRTESALGTPINDPGANISSSGSSVTNIAQPGSHSLLFGKSTVDQSISAAVRKSEPGIASVTNTNGTSGWQTQSTVKAYQPQFQIVSPNFQAGGQIMIPMGSGGPGGYVIGGAPAVMPAAQGVLPGNRLENAMGYGIPMNIVGYPVQLAGASPMQFAAVPNGAMGLQRSIPYGMQAQIMTMGDTKRSTPGGVAVKDIGAAAPASMN